MKSLFHLFLLTSLLPAVLFAPRAHAQAARPDDVSALVRGNTAFGLDLYGRLRAAEGNVFFSPYSISTALAMTYAGARGRTANEMAAVLRFPPGQGGPHQAFAGLAAQLGGDGSARQGFELHVANALWGQRGYRFLDEFEATAESGYRAGLKEVDFERETEQARRAINAWVEQQTNDKIVELLKPGILDETTRLVLTNAIYFKGTWAVQFKKELTKEEPFKRSSSDSSPAQMMHVKSRFKHFDGGTFQALELPYAGGELSMVVFLPKDVGGLAALEQALTAERLAASIEGLREETVDVALPKFKATSEFRLKPTLSAMGMPLAFSNAADFSGMTGADDLKISEVVHKAFVDVNEEGTEAAAATGVVVQLTSAMVKPPEEVRFVADHPFVFLIRDTRSGSVLFLGRVTDPRVD